MTDPGWVPHCEDENCSLGRFVYTCPRCGRDGDDYSAAWCGQDDVFDGKAVEFTCELCKGLLEVLMLNHNVIVRPKEPAVSKEHCLVVPNADQPSTDKNASVFLMAVVNVPGKTPYIASSERLCKELPENPTDCQVCEAVSSLLAEGVVKRAVDVAEEIRKNFMPKEAPCQTTDPLTPTPTSLPIAEPNG